MICNEDVRRLAAPSHCIATLDLEEFGFWYRAADAVSDLPKRKPNDGEHVH